jgi:hypothetical protein
MTPAELLQAILETLGMPSEGQRSAGSLRLELRAILAQLSEDGWQTGLVVDELQLAGPRLFEELRLLVNGMGTAGGVSRLLLVGQTSVLRPLSNWALGTLGARITTHVHLGPLDAEDARAWFERERPGVAVGASEVEAIHRDSGGNAAELRRLIRQWSVRPGRIRRDAAHPTAGAAPHPVSVPEATQPPAEPLIPTRPPVLEGEGLIEVGWTVEPTVAQNELARAGQVPVETEVVEDPYTALQAWQEWAATVNREAVGGASGVSETDGPRGEGPSVWMDPPQSHAPYGDLFGQGRPAAPHDT